MSSGIDNSSSEELRRVVTWQYDDAPHLNGIIDLINDFFTNAVSAPMGKVMELADLTDLDDGWSLNVWGHLLGFTRPILEYDNSIHEMSDDGFRNILLARLRMLVGNASTKEYIKYVNTVFSGNASFVDNGDMTVRVDWNVATPSTNSQKELKALYDNYIEEVMNPLPTGVRLEGDIDFKIFSISSGSTSSQDTRITNMNDNAGGCLFGGLV